MKKIFLIAFVSLCSIGALYAQSNSAITYSIGFATGDLGDYIGQPSFRGITFDYHKMVQPNVGVGFSLGWNTFYEDKPYDTYTLLRTYRFPASNTVTAIICQCCSPELTILSRGNK